MSRAEQQHKFLKAKVALSLYRAYGRVPKEAEIDQAYHLTVARGTNEAAPGAHSLRQQQRGQLVLL